MILKNFADLFLNTEKTFHSFWETPNVSTYLYCLVVGPFMEVKCEDIKYGIPMTIYVRESLYEKAKA